MSIPITIINSTASYDAVTRVINDYQFKKGNTDWELRLELQKHNNLIDTEITKLVLVQSGEVLGEITSDMYSLNNGVITIFGNGALVYDAGTFDIYVIVENNVSWKIRYDVADDLTFMGDIIPLPNVDATITGDMIIYNTTNGQTVTNKINELDASITNINSTLNDVNSNFEEIDLSIDNLNNSISDINNSLDSLDSINESITNINNSINDINDSIDSINNTLEYLKPIKYYDNTNVGGILTTSDVVFGTISGYDPGNYRLFAQCKVIRNDASANEQTITLSVYDGTTLVVDAEFSTYKDFNTSVTLSSGIKYNLTGNNLTLKLKTSGGNINVSNIAWSMEGGD